MILLLAAFFGLCLPCPAQVFPDAKSLVQEEILAEYDAVRPGQEFLVGVRFTMKPGWHIYWTNPGEAGIPTTVEWSSQHNLLQFSPVGYPTPRKFVYGGVVGYGYTGQAVLWTKVKVSDQAKFGMSLDLRAKTDWLVCEETCIPGGGELVHRIRIAQTPVQNASGAESLMVAVREEVRPLPGGADVSVEDGDWTVTVSLPSVRDMTQGVFIPQKQDPGPVQSSVEFRQMEGGVGAVIRFPLSAMMSGSLLQGVLRLESPSGGEAAGFRVEVPLVAAVPLDWNTFLKALLGAFVGGMILNIMPCVLPVISLKLMGLVKHAGQGRGEALRQGLWFAAGIFVTMWALALVIVQLKNAGQQVGWAFQFQSPAYVLALTVLCVVVALNLFGLFEVHVTPPGKALELADRGGWTGSLFNGVLAVVLATPCTAPFMGFALGFALNQPAPVIFMVLTGLAAGLAFPYVLLTAFPPLLRFLPRPGEWMVAFKQFLGFPMLLAAAWLFWVYGGLTDRDAAARLMIILIFSGLGLWIFGRQQFKGRPWRGALTGCAVVVAAVVATGILFRSGSEWSPWSKEAVEEARSSGRPVFVDFTADWCLSCKANELAALDTREVREEFQKRGVVLLKADWTRKNPEISRELEKHGRSGVPLYLYYPPSADKPVILPEVLTPAIVLDALRRP